MCPNINSPEWKALEAAVGRFEAMKDFMEYSDVRPVDEVRQKIQEREQPAVAAETKKEVDFLKEEMDTMSGMFASESMPLSADLSETQNNRANEIVEKLLRRMNDQVPVDYEVVTPEQAAEITANTTTPYTNEVAFFFNGKAYFVKGRVSTLSVFHEFSHPVVNYMSKVNPALFNKLYDKLVASSEGAKIEAYVRDKYKHLDPASDKFKEEVIVQALGMFASQKFRQEQQTDGFKKFMNDFLYAIKQAFRKIFGSKIDISKLNENTTLEELADMLAKGGQFKIDTQAVSDKDSADYLRDQINEVTELSKVAPDKVRVVATQAFDIAQKQIRMVTRNKNYKEMLNILADDFNRGDLQEISSNLKKYAKMLETKMDNLDKDVEYTKKQAEAMVNTIYRLQKMFEKINKQLLDMKKDTSINDRDRLQKAFYTSRVINHWKGFIEYTLKTFDDTQGLSKTSELYQVVSSIAASLQSAERQVNEYYQEGIKETLGVVLMPMATNIKNRFDSIIETLKRNNASQASIDRQYMEFYGMKESDFKEYDRMRELDRQGKLPASEQKRYQAMKRKNLNDGMEITQEKIDEMLKGNLVDANWANGYFEGYLYSDDPVVGGFALFVKSALSDVMLNSQRKYNDFSRDIKPYLEKAGYNPTNIGELGKKVGFKDKLFTGEYDENGKPKFKEVWTLLNPWRDYRFELDVLEDGIKNARIDYNKNPSKENKMSLIAAQDSRDQFVRKYMHQEYVPEYYNTIDSFKKDELGKEAFFERDLILEEIRSLKEKIISEADMFKVNDQLDALWRKYNLLHSLYDADGKPKDPESKAYKIALRLQQFREATKKFNEDKLRTGSFENALQQFKQSLLNRGLNPEDSNDQQAQDELNRWIDANTRKVIKDDYYKNMDRLLKRIKEIRSQIPGQKDIAEKEDKAFKIISDNISPFRDQDRQPNGTAMSASRIKLIKEAQEEINKLREEAQGGSGLTKVEQRDFSELIKLKKSGTINDEQLTKLDQLFIKKENNPLDEATRNELQGLYDELMSMSNRVPTQYYIDQVNEFIRKNPSEELRNEIGNNYLDKDTIDLIYDEKILTEMRKDAAFNDWFERNHLKVRKTDFKTKEEYDTYERVRAWSASVPSDDSYYETYELTDEKGNKITQPWLPSKRFYSTVVRDFYVNEKGQKVAIKTGYDFNAINPKTNKPGKVNLQVGVHVDNKGNWLPRMDVANSPFRNEAYYELQSKDPAMFDLLEKLKFHHLENQKGLSHDAKLYLDFPRFQRSALEAALDRKKDTKPDQVTDEGFLQWLVRRIREFFTGSKDMPDSGFNDSDEFRLVTLDVMDNERSNVRMEGLYDIDVDDVSTDITNGMMRYMLSAERHKKLVEINPTAQAIKSVLENNGQKDTKIVEKGAYLNNGEINYGNKKQKYLRKQFVDALIDREFQGVYNTGFGSDNKFMHNLSQGLFQTASLGFFALNIPSAIKNAMGAKFQVMIEAAAGRYFNLKDFAAAEAWSFKTMGELSMQIYKVGPKSLNVQMWEIFDPASNFEEKFVKEGLSRTIAKDVANFSWLMNFRKWTEAQATMQSFGAYMMRQQVETKDGNKVDYAEAWELNADGNIQLKENIKPEYGITYDKDGNQIIGEIFKQKREEIQAVTRNLQGAYDKFNQPEAQRYLAFRFISYLRRYFTTMFIDRFGFKMKNGLIMARYQPGLGTLAEGWYVTIWKQIMDITRSGPKRLTFMLPDERRAWLKMSADVIGLVLMYYAAWWLFGWDPDDEERYAKLREKSGALRGPFVADDEYAFNMGGWLENHALNLLVQTHGEQYQFLPIPGLGLKSYTEMLDLSSIAFGPTLQNYAKVAEDLAYLGTSDKRAYYQKEVGPYDWQQADGMKLMNHIAKSIGITGTTMDPAIALQNYMSIRSK